MHPMITPKPIRLVLAVGAFMVLGLFALSRPSPATIEVENTGSEQAPVITGTEQFPIDSVDENALARLPAEAQESIEKVLIPVLAPRSEFDASQAKVLVFGDDKYYSLKITTPDYGWILYGGRPSLREIPEPTPQFAHVRLRGGGGIISVSEFVWNLAWNENGISYLLTFACEKSGAHLCETPDAAIAVMNDLVLVRR